MAAKKQTPTPAERAQAELDRAKDHLAKLRERYGKALDTESRAQRTLAEAKSARVALAAEVDYETAHVDLLGKHPLLGGTGATPAAAFEPVPEGRPEPVEIPGQTTIEDHAAPEVRAIENDVPVRRVFSSAPNAAAPAADGGKVPGVGDPGYQGTVRDGRPRLSAAAVPDFDPTDATPMTADVDEDEAEPVAAQADAPFEL